MFLPFWEELSFSSLKKYRIGQSFQKWKFSSQCFGGGKLQVHEPFKVKKTQPVSPSRRRCAGFHLRSQGRSPCAALLLQLQDQTGSPPADASPDATRGAWRRTPLGKLPAAACARVPSILSNALKADAPSAGRGTPRRAPAGGQELGRRRAPARGAGTRSAGRAGRSARRSPLFGASAQHFLRGRSRSAPGSQWGIWGRGFWCLFLFFFFG